MRTVALEIVETTEEIYISVWDSGPEIPEKLRENILEYGVTTKKDGNGIGLFLVNQACERYNGYITIVSEAGTFYRCRPSSGKARTHRLIQEGAILEKMLPEVRTMELSVLEDYLIQKLPQHD